MIKRRRAPEKEILSGRRHPSIQFLALVIFISLAITVTADTGLAADSGYDPKEAGHPIRIISYVAHPVGVLIDYAILRPAYWLGQKEPFRTIFGQKAEFGQGSLRNEQSN